MRRSTLSISEPFESRFFAMTETSASFVAYIDESGDEGFTFKNPPQRASSEWFGIGAVIVRETRRLELMRAMSSAVKPIEENRKGKFHFSKIPHEAKTHIAESLGQQPCRTSFVFVNKKLLASDGVTHSLDQTSSRRLYFYLTRFLLERISWCARDHSVTGEGNGRCKLVFSKSESISYDDLKQYLAKLRGDKDVRIAWDRLEQRFDVAQHNDSLGCRLADAAVSGVACALELNRYGRCEETYVKHISKTIYSWNGNYSSYGLKFFPRSPKKEKSGRYEWLAGFKIG